MTSFALTVPYSGRHGAPAAASSAAKTSAGGPAAWGATLLRGLARRRQRQALADLDARLLADVGIDAAAARREAAKPFWR